MRALFFATVVPLLVSCASASPPVATAPPPSPGGRCAQDLGASPFQRKDATHILVADFFASRASEPDFADTVSHQVDGELKRYREELGDNSKMDVEVPEGSLEIQRLRCFVEDHDQARKIAEALKADVVVWGKAACNPTSQVTVVDQSHKEVHTGNVTAGHGSMINIGNSVVQAGKPYTVCPSATLYLRERQVQGRSGAPLSLGSILDLDLPTLQSSEPFMLVDFTLGMHFYEREVFPLAARFFKKSADKVLAGERNVEALELMLGRAYLDLPDLEQSLAYSRRALDQVRGTGSGMEATLENNIGSVLIAQGDYTGALEHLHRALAIDEKAYGPDHPEAAIWVSNIGSVLHEQGDYEGALEQFRRALAIDEKAYGPDHPNVAIRVNNIGGVLEAQGDDKGALVQLRRALAIDEGKLGPEHPSTRTDRENIAIVIAKQSGWKQDGKHPGAVVVRCVMQDCHGLQTGDWLLSYGAAAIRDTKHLIELVTSTPADRPVTLTILRDKRKLRLPAHGGRLGIELL